jgi:hypothetical protein
MPDDAELPGNTHSCVILRKNSEAFSDHEGSEPRAVRGNSRGQAATLIVSFVTLGCASRAGPLPLSEMRPL